MGGDRLACPGKVRRKGPGSADRILGPQKATCTAPGSDLARGSKERLGQTCFHRDLFGDPVPPARRPGRPRHVPTDATRAKVRELYQAGSRQPAIAAALGITVPTLTLNYPAELNSSSQTWRTRLELDRTKGNPNGE